MARFLKKLSGIPIFILLVVALVHHDKWHGLHSLPKEKLCGKGSSMEPRSSMSTVKFSTTPQSTVLSLIMRGVLITTPFTPPFFVVTQQMIHSKHKCIKCASYLVRGPPWKPGTDDEYQLTLSTRPPPMTGNFGHGEW
jgi:hypothetical protein